MRVIVKTLTLFVFMALLAGCSSTKPGLLTTVIHDTTHVPYYLRDSSQVIENPFGWMVDLPNIQIEYLEKEKKVRYTVHDTVTVTHTDTVRTPVEVKQELTLAQRTAIQWFLPSVAVTVVLFVLVCLLIMAVKFL